MIEVALNQMKFCERREDCVVWIECTMMITTMEVYIDHLEMNVND